MKKLATAGTITPTTRIGTVFCFRFDKGQTTPWGWLKAKNGAEFRYELVGTDWSGEGAELRSLRLADVREDGHEWEEFDVAAKDWANLWAPGVRRAIAPPPVKRARKARASPASSKSSIVNRLGTAKAVRATAGRFAPTSAVAGQSSMAKASGLNSQPEQETPAMAWKKRTTSGTNPQSAIRNLKSKTPGPRFDPANPWPEGSEIVLGSGVGAVRCRLREVDLENVLLTVLWDKGPNVGKTQTMTFAAWNDVYGDDVDEVRFPMTGTGDRGPGTGTEKKPAASAIPKSEIRNLKSSPPRADMMLVPLDRIDASHNVRKDLGEGGLLRLQESMQDIGQLEPVVIRQISAKQFRLVAGGRRLEATRRAGAELIEGKVYGLASGADDVWEAKARLAENVQRQDLNHMELAALFGGAVAAGVPVAEVAREAHLSDDMVRRHLSLLRLAPPVAELVATGKLPVQHAEIIARVGDHWNQIDLAADCLRLVWDPRENAWKSRTRHVFSWKEGDPEDDHQMPMEDLRKAISYALCGLAACGWLKAEADDPEWGDGFHPIAGRGRCAGCPDNTATYADQPTLFAGIHPQGSDKKGFCTNRPCYDSKKRAWDKVVEKRKAEEERKQAAAIKKAEKAGLDVCPACGRILPEGEKLQPRKDLNGAICCGACAEKEKKRGARGGGSADSYAAKEAERVKLLAKFPWTDGQRLALATWEWGQAAGAAIGRHIEGMDCHAAREAAAAICCTIGVRLISRGRYDEGVTIECELKAPPVFGVSGMGSEKKTAGALALIWRDVAMLAKPQFGTNTQWNDEKPTVGHDGKAEGVPLSPAAMGLCDLYQELGARWNLFHVNEPNRIPPRPTAESMAEKTTGTEEPPAHPAARLKRISTVATGNRPAAMAALGQCDAQDLPALRELKELKGDWRRAAVHKTIDLLADYKDGVPPGDCLSCDGC